MHQFDHPLRPFQQRFVTAALRPGVDTAALSIPRGNGKSWLAAHILTRCLTPGDPLNVPGAEYLLAAASIEQARLVYRFVRDALKPAGAYRFLDSAMRIGVTHKGDHDTVAGTQLERKDGVRDRRLPAACGRRAGIVGSHRRDFDVRRHSDRDGQAGESAASRTDWNIGPEQIGMVARPD